MKKAINKIRGLIGRQLFLSQHPALRVPNLHPPGEFISDNIRTSGRHYELGLLVRYADQFDFSNYVGVGANIGAHVNFFSRLGAGCVAFEASMENFHLLQKNAPGAQVHHCAVAEKAGTERFVTYG